MHHRITRLAIPTGLLVTGAIVVGCAPAASSGDDVTLSVWSWQASSAPKWEAVFDVYEESNPGVTIEFEGYQPTEYNQILATGMTGSDGPDVAMLRAYGGVQPAIQADQLVPIDDVVDGLDQFEPSVLRAAQGVDDGATYGVPFAYQTMHMFYNKTIFDEQGLEEPTTWDEFIALQEDLLDADITPMALGARDAWVLPMFADIVGSARYGGTQFEEKVLSGETDFTDDDYVASLEIVEDMQEYLDKDVNAIAVADATLQFASGQAAQWPGGSFDLPTFQESAPDTEWGVYDVPPPPGAVLDEAVTPGYADGSFGINASSDQQDAAADLLRWMTTTEFGQLVADEVDQFSPVPGVSYSDPLMQEMNELYEANPAPYLLLVDFRYGDPTGTDVLGPDIQALFLGEKTPENLAEDLQAGVSSWFTPSP
ncbi:extracellular solute-binding protein [Microbacterium sp. JB110]|nr:extracellular solute-binding protein [Microbacterium sp. JB110]SJM66164.1 N-Acetyl-D-glucosamine ABC transport system, sugar-binding protein [Frigoribacterium sp. JB110]